jgi:hypothetical protein
MAAHKTAFRASQSIAGAALVAFGMFILYQNVAGAVAELTRILGANGSQALGVVPAVVLALSKVLQACPDGRPRFLHDFLQRALLPYWPVLLVRVGTVLSRDAFLSN